LEGLTVRPLPEIYVAVRILS